MNAHLRLFAGKTRGKAGGKRGKQAPCGENLLNLRKLPQKEAGTCDEKTKENAVPHHRRSGSGAGAQAAAASAHVGGELAHKLKFAGWDFVIIEGEAKSPVYLYIHNEKVEIRDASAAWGQGTRRSGHAGKMRLFRRCRRCLSLFCSACGESINTARTPVVPERGKTGVYNTILSGVF